MTVDPRLKLTGRVGERWTLVAALGKYSRGVVASETYTENLLGGGSGSFNGPLLIGQLQVPAAYRQLIEPQLSLGVARCRELARPARARPR